LPDYIINLGNLSEKKPVVVVVVVVVICPLQFSYIEVFQEHPEKWRLRARRESWRRLAWRNWFQSWTPA
jgi:hypothetical protein